MSRHVLSVRHRDVLPLLGLALVFPWLWLTGTSLRELFANATLTVTGYLRRRPDSAVECQLRTAFTEFDRDLAEILGDRTPAHLFNRWASTQKIKDAGHLPTTQDRRVPGIKARAEPG
jgi:hypothetical protein